MPEERNRKISIQLASQCAPTFLRVKPSSLMMLCPEDTEVLEVQTRKAGVSRCLLYRGNQRDMWLLYREEELNDQIRKFAIGWDISRISRLTRCILQLAIFEILYVEDVPTGVAVSEAVRLAKKYDGDDTGSFVNGILGSFVRSLPAQDKKDEV